MNIPSERPVSMDLSSQQDMGSTTNSDTGLNTRQETDHSGQQHPEQQQQLEKDASRLKEIIHAKQDDLVPSRYSEPAVSEYTMEETPQEPPVTYGSDPDRLPHENAQKGDPSVQTRAISARAEEQPVPTEGIFGLFNQMKPLAPTELPATEMGSPAMHELDDNLARLARTLMVGERVNGSEAVRMELNSETFPGVTLEVFKDRDVLVAQFICGNSQSRTQLNLAAPWLGRSLSSKLSRDTLVRVMTDDPEDPCTVEAQHSSHPQ